MNEIEYEKAMHVRDMPPIRFEMSSEEKFKTELKWNRDKNLSIFEDKLISYIEGEMIPRMTNRESWNYNYN